MAINPVLSLVLAFAAIALGQPLPVDIQGAPKPYTSVNGKYHPTSDKINGQITYKKDVGDLWICTDENGYWNVQPTAQKGTAEGYMISSDVHQARPDEARTWRIWQDGDWKPAAMVTIGAVKEKHQAKDANASQEAPVLRAMLAGSKDIQPQAVSTTPSLRVLGPAPAPAAGAYGPPAASLSQRYFGTIKGDDRTSNVTMQISSAHSGTLMENGQQSELSIAVTGKNVAMKALNGQFTLQGVVKDDGSIFGTVMGSGNSQIGDFNLKPGVPAVGAHVDSPFGRLFFMVTCVSLLIIIGLYFLARRSRYPYVRMYLHKVIGSALTLLAGQLIAQVVSGLIIAVAPNFLVEALLLFVIFTLGWTACTLIAWRFQLVPKYRMLITLLGADILGFVGFDAFEATWKVLVVRTGWHAVQCAFAMWAFSILVLYTVWAITERVRKRLATREPAAVAKMRAEWEEDEASRSSKSYSCQIRGCENPFAYTQVGGGGWFGTAKAEEPLATKATDAAPRAPRYKPPKMKEGEYVWMLDVIFAENTTISIIEAFMIFKTTGLIYVSWPGFQGVAMAGGLVLFLVILGIVLVIRPGVNQLEHIFLATLARYFGLRVIDGVSKIVNHSTDGAYIITPMVTLLVAFVFVMAIVFVIGLYFYKKDPNGEEPHFGLLSGSSGRKDRYGSKDPEEVAGLGMALSMALMGCITVLLGEVASANDFSRSHSVLSNIVVATVMTLVMLHYWFSNVLPRASKTAKDHLGEISACDQDEEEALNTEE